MHSDEKLMLRPIIFASEADQQEYALSSGDAERMTVQSVL